MATTNAAPVEWASYGLCTDFDWAEGGQIKDLVQQAEALAKKAQVPDWVRKAYMADVQKAAVKARKDALKASGSWVSRAKWRGMTDAERAEHKAKQKPEEAEPPVESTRRSPSAPPQEGERGDSPMTSGHDYIMWVCVEVEDEQAPAGARLDWLHVSELKGQRAWADPNEAQLALQQRAVERALQKGRAESARRAQRCVRRVTCRTQGILRGSLRCLLPASA